MFRILESQAPARQTATDTINTLSSRLQSATLLEDRRAAILGLRSFAKEFPASVASGALRALISSLRNDAEDVDTTKVVLETLLMLFAPEQSSPEASEELALWLADEFTQRQDNITILLDLLESSDFYSRLYSLQLISQISSARPERTQECIFTAPLGISRLVTTLGDPREPIRNESLLLLIALTPSSAELQKVVAFENAFDRIFFLIENEGSLSHGSGTVEDCLSLLGNLLSLNVSNQSYFRETGFVKKFTSLLAGAVEVQGADEEISEWTLEQRDKNLWGTLAIIQLFLVKGSVSTPINQMAFWQSGMMQQVLRIAFNDGFNVAIRAKALSTCACLISANTSLQENFADLEVAVIPNRLENRTTNGTSINDATEKLNVIEALLRVTLLEAPIQFLDVRLAACSCIQAFTENHPGIRAHFLRRAIDGHSSGSDRIPNILTILVNSPENRRNMDPYQIWLASVLLFHLIHSDPETKSLAMKVTEGDESSGEEVITCVQAITGNLLTGIQRNEDKRISVGYLMLLCGWLFEDPDVVNDFLGEGSSIQRLIQEAKNGISSKTLIPGLCAILLGIVYEFSSKDSPIPRTTLHQLLLGLGRELYIDKITRLREHALVRDFEVLPQTCHGHHDSGLPSVYFDKMFIDFLKDNFSRFVRAIDREPGIEVPVLANGVPKGISRDLVDSLRAQVEDKSKTIQTMEEDMLSLRRKLEQEQLDHRKTRESLEVDLTHIRQTHETLGKSHAEEIRRLQEHYERSGAELVSDHSEKLRTLEMRQQQTCTEYETQASKIREQNDLAVAELTKSIKRLEKDLEKANKDHAQDLRNAHEEYSSTLAYLEARNKGAEEREEQSRQRASRLETQFKDVNLEIIKYKTKLEDSETARKTVQSELDDLLIVFADLEAKRNEDKKRLKSLGQEVSDIEDSDSDGEVNDDEDPDPKSQHTTRNRGSPESVLAMSIDFPSEEELVLKRWKEIGAFERQVELSRGRKPYTFYDGPPFATGLPHYGHLLASTIKDIIPRYWSMKGHYVERRFGWDTHGVPIEYEIDKKLKMSGSEAVEKLGLAQYNAECKAIVMTYAQEWRQTIDRLGRWIDFDNDYKTMDTTFMETLWWVLKQLFDKGAVYRGYRVMPCSTALNTPLSNFEASQNYKDVQDPAVVVSFPLIDDPKTNLLAWTTTPWTLPSHLALAAHPDFEYIKLHDEQSGKDYILLESLLGTLYKNPKKAKFKILDRFKGSTMEGWKYTPPFDYFYEKFKDVGFRVLMATYVTSDSGVGIVHQAPAFGEEDYNVAMNAGVISDQRLPPNPVDSRGCFTSEVRDFAGTYVKTADKAIIKYLKENDRLVVDSQITHNYPFCWRSDTPLIYRAVPAWFVKIEPIIPKMLAGIEESYWVPSFVKDKRFASWIANARDWNISRNRYWGTPIPLWVSDDYEEVVAIGSVDELRNLSGYTGELTDLHRDKIDHITIPSRQGKGVLHRVEEVFDCWFESGSMPYASQHYPFENKEQFEKSFPGDFIAEGLDQTRGWFYTLTVLGTHLFGKLPFKNCVVNGIVLAEDGKKMSKRLKNYPDPMLIMERYGSDALRLYLINSPVVRAEPLRFKEAGVKEVVAKVLLPLWNSYKFFDGQVVLLKKVENLDYVFDPSMEATNTNVMDRWILASCQSLLKFVNEEMAGYRLYTVVPRLLELIDNTTNWYIRFNRRRLKGELGLEDTKHALNTLFEVIYTLVRGLAPFTPFLTDNIYLRLLPHIPESLRATDDRSVHFLSFPEVREELFDEVVERQVSRMQRVIELARVSRERRSIGLKTPLKTLVVVHNDQQYLDDVRSLEQYIVEELNVRDLVLSTDEAKYNVQYSATADWPVLGKKLKKDVQKVKKALPQLSSDEIKGFILHKKILVDGIELVQGDLVVKRGIKEDAASANLETNTDDDVLVILDATLYPELAHEGLTREIVNRIQRLRKKAGLVPTDDVKMEYRVISDPDSVGISEVFETQASAIEKALRRPVDKHVTTEIDGEVPDAAEEGIILEEVQEVQKATFLLRLLTLQPDSNVS
ncbi:isoleucine--tRNA ligase [Ophidiomyces ophidiicola]|nr:isoleucine--tRNA ligase [Ophidiomyces ophidiicola]KAI2144467.1 isoleucine--tRNA ligase [Ophidiomyces ophidiicola]KAI2147297.1 isoleucine--tRNA ligase [Ophidiomyces ophidiicola]KAI2209331.1 isoleucine--tRNA ligase [Ophidiomyces ophidiicola]KAI2432772.1 isoleucine--tRNA ligase [Ophidiomyces ophidiicola]